MNMKIFKILSLIVVFSGLFFSCEKEEIKLPVNNNTPTPTNRTVEGTEWVVTHGYLYMENLDNGELTVYDHFGPNKTESSLSAFSSGTTMLDTIKQNYTTWFFYDGTFTLNGDESWEYTDYNDTYSVIGLSGGTSRPITVIDISDNSLSVVVYEAYNSYNGVNYHYFTILTLTPLNVVCNGCYPDVMYGWTHGGVYEQQEEEVDVSIIGTRWVVTRYLTSFGNYYPNDTLDFINGNKYTINGGSQRTYTLSGVVGNNMKSLDLWGFTTLGGDYSGQVHSTFIEDGVINNSNFHDMFNVNNTVVLWMERIQ